MKSLWMILLLTAGHAGAATEIRVEREGYHTALLLPVSAAGNLSPLPVLPAGTKWIRFGWGDRDYYGSARKSAGRAARALLMPTPSVVEVVALPAAGHESVAVMLEDAELAQLQRFIRNSFRHDAQGRAQLLRSEVNGFRYYAAHGHYHLLRNCNHWTARALQQAGQEVHWRRAVLAGSVMKQLD